MSEKELYSVIVNPNGDGWLVGQFNARVFEVKGQFDDEDRAQEYADELNRQHKNVKLHRVEI